MKALEVTRVEVGLSRFNEVFEKAGAPRSHYEPLLEALERLGSERISDRLAAARRRLGEMGVTFAPDDVDERIIPVDWMPRIVPDDHWQRLSDGLLQRGRAINAWLETLYGEGQDVVPDDLVRSSVFYRPHEIPAGSAPVRVYGPDVVHMGSGEYVVLEDNVRVPSGVAYSEAIRRAGLDALPELFRPYRVADIFSYYDALRRTLEDAAPEGVDEPNVAVVTRGSGDAAFFEHDRIAEACGLPLLTLADCYVRGGEVRARPDGRRLDVIYRRFDEDYVDTDLPELEKVYLEDRVRFVNGFGAGVADDKAIFPYVPKMIEACLGERPILANAPTYSLTEEEPRSEALERLPELVLKPRQGYGAQGLLVGPEASREEVRDARHSVRKNPTGFVAQETLEFSTHVLDGDGGSDREEVFIDLRAFVLPALGYVMAGGLTRVARPGTRVVNSTAGGGCKDTWVLEA